MSSLSRKDDGVLSGSPSVVIVLVVEDIFASEPSLVNEVILFVAYP